MRESPRRFEIASVCRLRARPPCQMDVIPGRIMDNGTGPRRCRFSCARGDLESSAVSDTRTHSHRVTPLRLRSRPVFATLGGQSSIGCNATAVLAGPECDDARDVHRVFCETVVQPRGFINLAVPCESNYLLCVR